MLVLFQSRRISEIAWEALLLQYFSSEREFTARIGAR